MKYCSALLWSTQCLYKEGLTNQIIIITFQIHKNQGKSWINKSFSGPQEYLIFTMFPHCPYRGTEWSPLPNSSASHPHACVQTTIWAAMMDTQTSTDSIFWSGMFIKLQNLNYLEICWHFQVSSTNVLNRISLY